MIGIATSDILKKALQASPEERERQRKALEKHLNETDEYLKKESPLMWKSMFTTLSRNDLLTKTFATFKPNSENLDIFDKFQKWSPKSQFGVFLYGETGTGKTHLLKALTEKWGSKDYQTLFTATASMFDAMRENLDTVTSAIQSYAYPDLLVIDDFGAEKSTDWTREKFLLILEKRLREDKITFLSSNLKLDELRESYDMRTLDRLKELMVFVEMPGKTFRNTHYKANREKWENLK